MTAAVGSRIASRRRPQQRGTGGTSPGSGPDRVKELALLGLIVVAVFVFALADRQLPERAVVQADRHRVAIVAHPRRRPGAGDHQPQHRPVGRVDRRGAPLTSPATCSAPTRVPAAVVAASWRSVVGAILGSVNGLLVAYGGVPAIIVTLGTLAIYRARARRAIVGCETTSPPPPARLGGRVAATSACSASGSWRCVWYS